MDFLHDLIETYIATNYKDWEGTTNPFEGLRPHLLPLIPYKRDTHSKTFKMVITTW